MNRSLTAPSRLFLWTALGVIVVGAALALVGLGRESLWLDETYTWYFVRLDWGRVLEAARIDAVNPPLFYLFVKALTASSGLSETALRLPSAIAQMVGIAAAIFLGYRLAGAAGGIAAGGLWATQPLLVWASQDARPYSLAGALAAGAAGVFVAARRSRSPAWSVAAIVLLALGSLTHYFFFVLAAALLAVALFEIRRSPIFFRRWALLTLAALVPLAGWLAWFFSQGSPSLGIGWIRAPTLADLPLTLWNLVSGYAGIPDAVSTVYGLLVLVLVAAGLSSGENRRFARILAVGGLLLPLAAVWALSQRRPVYVDRYFILLMPIVAALAALGAQEVARRLSHGSLAVRAALVLCALFVAAGSGLSVRLAPKFHKEDWRGLVNFLEIEGASVESLSLSEPEITLPLTYYGLLESGTPIPELIPACREECWWVYRQSYTATHAVTQSVKEVGRGNELGIPMGCSIRESWASPTGVGATHLSCPK